MNFQDSQKNISQNFSKKIFNEEEPKRYFLLDDRFGITSEQPIPVDQETSVSFARMFFSQDLEDAATILRLVEKIEALRKNDAASSKARIDLFSLVLARNFTRKQFYCDGLFLPRLEERVVLCGYEVSILAPACIVLARDVQPSLKKEIIEIILEEALKNKCISKEGLAVLKMCIAADRVVTLNEEEGKEAFDKGWERHEEQLSKWKNKISIVTAKKNPSCFQAFFDEQTTIGTKWPQELYPQEHDISIYQQADVDCLASIDSPDWRKREISIRLTDAAIDFIDEVLRTPIIEASLQAFASPDHPSIQELMRDHIVYKFPFSAVPNLTKLKSKDTRNEYNRFPIHQKSNSVCIAVSEATLLEIAQRIVSLLLASESSPGPVLNFEIQRRLGNIFKKLMQPEIACMRAIEGNPNVPKLTFGHVDAPFSEGVLHAVLLIEIGRRAIKQGLNPRLVDALVEPFIHLHEREEGKEDHELIDFVKGLLIRGQTADKKGLLSW